eukprot:Platyproteum_vivax@DN8261_c0_g1_i1.p1
MTTPSNVYAGVTRSEKKKKKLDAKRRGSKSGIIILTIMAVLVMCLYICLLYPKLWWQRQIFYVPLTSGIVAYLSVWTWQFEVNCKTKLLFGSTKEKYQRACAVLNKMLETNSLQATANNLCQVETLSLGFIDFGCNKFQNIHTGSIVCAIGLLVSLITQLMAIGYLWWWHVGNRRKTIPRIIAICLQGLSSLAGICGIGVFLGMTGDLSEIFRFLPYVAVSGPENHTSFFVGFYLAIVAMLVHLPLTPVMIFITQPSPEVEEDVQDTKAKDYNEKLSLLQAAAQRNKAAKAAQRMYQPPPPYYPGYAAVPQYPYPMPPQNMPGMPPQNMPGMPPQHMPPPGIPVTTPFGRVAQPTTGPHMQQPDYGAAV